MEVVCNNAMARHDARRVDPAQRHSMRPPRVGTTRCLKHTTSMNPLYRPLKGPAIERDAWRRKKHYSSARFFSGTGAGLGIEAVSDPRRRPRRQTKALQ